MAPDALGLESLLRHFPASARYPICAEFRPLPRAQAFNGSEPWVLSPRCFS